VILIANKEFKIIIIIIIIIIIKGDRKGTELISGDSASRPKRRLMRTYFWISFFT
jgi:hypothetical protein